MTVIQSVTGQGDQSVGHCPTMLLVRNKGTMKKTRLTSLPGGPYPACFPSTNMPHGVLQGLTPSELISGGFRKTGVG